MAEVKNRDDDADHGSHYAFSTQDHEPRCDCGHLFEICDAPNCSCAASVELEE